MLRELLRIINSDYYDLIEGHNTHPHDIVRAMQKEFDSEPARHFSVACTVIFTGNYLRNSGS